MNKVTHRRFSVGFGYILVMLLYMYELLKVNYYWAFVIIVTISQVGARFPDYDHSWKNIADKDAVKFVINKIIKITGGNHRSRHTHSIDLFVIAGVALFLLNYVIFRTGVNYSVGMTIIAGFMCGWASHLVADALTNDGIYIVCWWKKKVRLVPKSLSRLWMCLTSLILLVVGLGIKVIFDQYYGFIVMAVGVIALIIGLKYGGMKFKTGEEWEGIVQRSFVVFNVILGVTAFIFPVVMALGIGVTDVSSIINIITN